jgi:hypothetical protein
MPSIYVVSGLPRSGTSMMMRMLSAGGLPVLTDERRSADADNPRGYFELEAVRSSARDASWTQRAAGRAVKVISYLLPHLPADLDYRVVFLRRGLDQVVRSQRAMLDRLGTAVARTDDDGRRALADHLVEIETWLEHARHMHVLGVSYERVLAEPAVQIERIVSFLGVGLDRDKMAAAVEPALRRQ